MNNFRSWNKHFGNLSFYDIENDKKFTSSSGVESEGVNFCIQIFSENT